MVASMAAAIFNCQRDQMQNCEGGCEAIYTRHVRVLAVAVLDDALGLGLALTLGRRVDTRVVVTQVDTATRAVRRQQVLRLCKECKHWCEPSGYPSVQAQTMV